MTKVPEVIRDESLIDQTIHTRPEIDNRVDIEIPIEMVIIVLTIATDLLLTI